MNERIARIPPKFLNSLGCINYDHNGNVPWTEDEIPEIFLSEEYKSITNFLGLGCKIARVGPGDLKVNTLKRVSIVNEYGYCVFDAFINSMDEIMNSGTPSSGTHSENVTQGQTLKTVQQKVADLVKGKTIVGHSIHYDLRALQLNGHNSTRDTAVYFLQKTKAKRLSSLKQLTKDYLNAVIESGEHSSIENAQAAMKLNYVFRDEWEVDLKSQKFKKDKKKAVRLPCGHKQKVSCDTNIATFKCKMDIKKKLPCGHRYTVSCHLSLVPVDCSICAFKKLASQPKEIEENIAKIPSKYLNALGYVNYDHYGNFPWTEEEKAEIFLSEEYKSITNFIGIDCEMVGVGERNIGALGRVSIVNEYGYCVYDTFVNPMVQITDYRTKYSGIRRKDLVTAPPKEVVLRKVAELVEGKTLVGNAIQNDLGVLRLGSHRPIRDTAKYFQQMTKAKQTSSLKQMTSDYLNANIQLGEHSSIEDAQATMKLYSLYREMWELNPESNTNYKKPKVRLPCGHKTKQSSDTDVSKLKCDRNVKKFLPCGHRQKALCHQSSSTLKCEICRKKVVAESSLA